MNLLLIGWKKGRKQIAELLNEAPRRLRWGIKRHCAIAYPPSLIELWHLRQAAGYSGEGE